MAQDSLLHRIEELVHLILTSSMQRNLLLVVRAAAEENGVLLVLSGDKGDHRLQARNDGLAVLHAEFLDSNRVATAHSANLVVHHILAVDESADGLHNTGLVSFGGRNLHLLLSKNNVSVLHCRGNGSMQYFRDNTRR